MDEKKVVEEVKRKLYTHENERNLSPLLLFLFPEGHRRFFWKVVGLTAFSLLLAFTVNLLIATVLFFIVAFYLVYSEETNFVEREKLTLWFKGEKAKGQKDVSD